MTSFNLIIEAPALGSTLTVEASSRAEAIAIAERDNPGWTVKREAGEAANVAAWRAKELELELAIDEATQWATIYRQGRPVATAERRRVLDKSAPDWTIYATDGRKLFTLWAAGRDPAARIKRRLAAYLVDHEPPAIARIAELVKRKRELLDQRVQTAGHGRRARLQQEIDAIAAELEQLANGDQAAEAEPATRWRNHYTCTSCGNEWEDEWDCQVDDDCSACGARHMSPHTSEEIEA